MGFLDKVKAQAEQAVAKAQQGVQQGMQQGQAKLDQAQARRQADALLHDLGAAYYAEQRQGGSSARVGELLAQLDAHAAQVGPVDLASARTGPVGPAGPAPTTPTAGPASPQPPSAPAGNFSLDDL